MARRVFFSFHYQRDIWRVNQIRSIPNITGCSAAGFQDASLWEEAKTKGDAEVKRLIDNGLKDTTVTVVCIGAKTFGRTYINYEIEQSILQGNGIIGIFINHLSDQKKQVDPVGKIPPLLLRNGYNPSKYESYVKLKSEIERAAIVAGR